MHWIDVAPVALAGVAWLLVPGLLMTYAWGLRGFAAWGLAPIASVALVATTAVVAGKIGVAWSVPLVCGVAIVLAGLIAVASLLLRRRFAVAAAGDPLRTTLIGVAGLVPALVLAAYGVFRGMGSPTAISQTYDAIFHYNALALIRDTHDASSLTIGSLGNPTQPATFYPAAWHDMVSLVLLSTATTIPVAANVGSAVIAIVVWPVSCMLLVRQIAGPSRAALAVTGLVSVGFTAFPDGLLGFGVLWPNTLGMALAPAALALVLSLTGTAEQDAIGKTRAWSFLPIAFLGCGFAHPNVVFSLVVLAVFPVGTALLRRAGRLRGLGHWRRGAAEIVVVVAASLIVWWWAATTPVFAAVRAQYWPPFETPARAAGEVLLNATNGKNALWLLSLVVVVGLVLAARTRGHRWLVGGHLASAALFVITAAINRPDTVKFTGFWYNDSFRLAAMLPITAVPLAVLGLVWVAQKVRAFATGENATEWSRRLAERRLASMVPVSAVLVLLLALLTKGMYLSDRAAAIRISYPTPPAGSAPPTAAEGAHLIVDNAELAFFQRVRNILPPKAVVMDNPWDGGALLWAIADRKTLYPHVSLASSDQQLYLARHLVDAMSDPAVCAAARTEGSEYVIIGDHRFSPASFSDYAGLNIPDGKPGFQLLAADGLLKLYRVSACWGPQPETRN